MTRVCVIRHGETDWNCAGRIQGREDIELNAKGRAQAKSCSEQLLQFQWDIIASSPLKRARETAQIISGQLGSIPVIEIFDFTERDFGVASGLTAHEAEIKFPDGIVLGWEEFDVLKDRAMKAMKNIVEKYEGMNIIVVSHGGLINAMLSYITNGDVGTGKTILKNMCINRINYDGEKWELELFNYSV